MKNTFKLYPDLKSYHETSDGQKFFIPTDAANHARTLTDRTVEEVKRGSEKKAANDDQKDSKILAIQAAKLRKEAIEKLETVEAVEVGSAHFFVESVSVCLWVHQIMCQ